MSGAARQRVVDQGHPRKYWTQVPNLVDDSDLDPFARVLYLHCLRIAGQKESCEETVRESAERCHMSPASVLKARAALEDGGWITVEDTGGRGRGALLRIHLLDRWGENMARYADADPGNVRHTNNSEAAEAENCSPGSTECSPHEQFGGKCSPHEQSVRHTNISISDPFLREDVKEPETKEPEKKGVARARARGDVPPPTPPPAVQTETQQASRRRTEADVGFQDQMVARWEPVFGSAEAVRDRMAVALCFEGSKKYSDQQAYVRNWLRRDAERLPASPPARNGRTNGNPVRDTAPGHDYHDSDVSRRMLAELLAEEAAAASSEIPGGVP